MSSVRAILIVMTVLTIWACGKSGSDSGTAVPDAPRVALIMKSLANEFFKTMEDGARDYHAANRGAFTLIANGIKNEEDVSGQITLVEQMIAQEVDALVIAPANSQALIPVLKRARERGIIVVNIDNKLDTELLTAEHMNVPFVGPDNRKGARMVGDYLGTMLSAGAEVAIIGGISTAFNAQQRQLGFEQAMDAAGAKIVSVQNGDWEQAKASTIASAIISEYPGLVALLCSNDNMAIGAVRSTARRDQPCGSSKPRCCLTSQNVTSIDHRIAYQVRICSAVASTQVE